MNGGIVVRYIVDNDLHIHSKISICSSDEKQTNERILEYAEKNNFNTICLTNHFWDEKINGAFEIPLLYEAGFEKYFDAVLAVWVPQQLSRKRLYGRNFSDEEITRRTQMQLDADIKLEKADFAVINTGNPDDMTSQLDKLFAGF